VPAPGFGSQPTLEFSTFQRVGRRDPGERTRPACYMTTPESGKSLRNARGNSPTSRGVATELPRQAEAAPWQPEFGPPQEAAATASVRACRWHSRSEGALTDTAVRAPRS